ncbi:MAG: hypothetical protein Q9171_000240 [Xanthocarpia ochracea]
MRCMSESQDTDTRRQGSTAPIPFSSPPTYIGDEFSGLELRFDGDFAANQFTVEAMGLFAIAALKEQALLQYDAFLTDLDFMDHVHPVPPIRIVFRAETPSIHHREVRRSTVIWAISRLAVEMMRGRILHRLPFQVFYLSQLIYSGFVALEDNPALPASSGNDSLPAERAHFTPASMTVIPINSTNVSLKNVSIQDDHPQYSLSFGFIDQRSSVIWDYYIFRALIAALLQLAKLDAASSQLLIAVTTRELQAWVFMREVRPLPEDYRFQQYHAVAIVEAIARYYELHGQYREMTFQFRANGRLLAEGCVTKPVPSRQWCRGMFTGAYSATADGLDQVAATN